MSKPITDFFAASPKKRKAEPAEAESGSQEKTEAKESKSTLTAEQQARAEENKKKAMEKLAAKRQKVMEVAAAAAAAADDDEKKADSADGYGILPSILEGSWREHLAAEFDKASFKGLVKFLNKEEAAGKKIFPPKDQVFNAFNNCPFENVKVVIIGQDPYHNPGEAMGMCFSVPRGVKVPSSLRNIYKELSTDITKGPHKFSMPKHGDLTKWAQQGVLLLNAVLTVQAKTPTSHQKQGWENFTDAAISAINKDLKGVVFLLWGRHAQEKAKLIDGKKHHILKTVHPSGLSASKGFFGCKHFSKANDLLKTSGKEPIDWNVD